MKRETIEEAAKRYANDWEEIHPTLDSENMTPIAVSKIDFIEGAKWQAERMYSDLSELRNDLYDKLPIGDVDAFEILKVIKNHLQKLDALCGNK